jgi:predicted Zn-dependent protease
MTGSDDAADLLRAGRHDEARAACLGRLAEAPDDADARHMMGVVCAVGGAVTEAAEWLRSAAVLDPADGTYQAGLGRLEAALGLLGSAESSSRRAVRLRPQDVRTWQQLAEIRLVADDLDGVIGLSDEMAGRVPADQIDAVRGLEAVARGQRAERNRAAGEFDDAIGDLRAIVAMTPHDVAARVNLAATLCRLDRRHAAQGHARAALRLDRDNPGAWVNLAVALAGLGQEGEARDALRHAAVRAPDQPKAWLAVARLEHEANATVLADQAQRRAAACAASGAPAN